MLRIGLDAMGGDYAPRVVVQGALMALDQLDSESRIVLFGDRGSIEAVIEAEGRRKDCVDIVHTTEVITMNDHPTRAYQQKRDSSIRVGFRYLKQGLIDGFASAGTTGAMMVGALYSSETIKNVIRPAISVKLANARGGYSLLLDVGLNVDCKPDVLYQYGLIGSVYAQSVLGIDNPRVGLLNIGEEREKGNLAAKAAYEMMQDNGLYNFAGNVEGRDIFTSQIADVIVCDGFTGNVILKSAESMYEIAHERGIDDPFFNELNYEAVGGTSVLGTNAIVTIGHGCSSAMAIKNLVLHTAQSIRSNVVTKLQETFAEM